MQISNRYFSSWDQLQEHLKQHSPTLYCCSGTSTVIPFSMPQEMQVHLEQAHLAKNKKGSMENFTIAHLSGLPKKMHMGENNILEIHGPVTWQEARTFARGFGRDLVMAPTDENAAIIAGISTSATGERCFAGGNLRQQVQQIQFLDGKGDTHLLQSQLPLLSSAFITPAARPWLQDYQDAFRSYEKFKNAPFPRLQQETDLLIGAEGQLGVVSAVHILTQELSAKEFLLLPFPSWRQDFTPHLAFFHYIQNYRGVVQSCEFTDGAAVQTLLQAPHPPTAQYLPLGMPPFAGEKDLIFLEIETTPEHRYEEFIENLMQHLADFSLMAEEVLYIPEEDFHLLRTSIPSAINERNQMRKVSKKATDIQVSPTHYASLLQEYQRATTLGIDCNLFGHFGDAHLHFNFLPTTPQEVAQAQEYLQALYGHVHSWRGSPFAEHGIGLLKQQFMDPFYSPVQRAMFRYLKEKMDPHQQFFPQGFINNLSLKGEACKR